MKFFRSKEDTHVKKIRAVRAKFIDPDHNEIDVEFINEAGDHLTLHLKPEQAKALYMQIGQAYQAINPPLNVRDYSGFWGSE